MGVIMSQFWTYWLSDYDDPLWTRAMVAFLFILNATQAGSLVYMLWFYCVANFANPAVITQALWPYSFTAMVTAILAIINQSFQSWRIYAFTKNKILTGFLFVTLVATFGMGLAASIQSWIFSEHVVVKVAAIQPIVEANLSFQMALDVLIAGILTWIFSKSKTSFKRTDKVLNRLIRTAVQSGSFTAVFALGTLFTFRFAPGTYMLAIFALPIGRIYTHTMMDHLITRQELRAILSNNGELVTVPNFNNSQGREAGRDGTAIMLRTTASHASSPSHLKGVNITDSSE
ncbi:hypothetical protein C8R47DRAFT_1314520 [Mycena vitilis]|nr:hypothetical protein C8R47DRAFT_1314520 [Mycena vitilis]